MSDEASPEARVHKMDDAFFEKMREFSEAMAPYYEEQAQQRKEAVVRLQERFADRGLRFTIPFAGSMPVQAYGHIDGLRFYFRYRWGGARLSVGPYERELEELRAARMAEAQARRAARAQERFDAGEIDERDLQFEQLAGSGERPAAEDDPDFYPERIVKEAHYEDPEGGGLKGDLTGQEAEDFFAILLDTLEDVPEAQQLPERTRILYYEGWAAVEAWDEARAAEFKQVWKGEG